MIEVAPERLEGCLSRFRDQHGEDGATVSLDRFLYEPFGLVLIRRGGYAVGLVRDGRLVASKVGTRHVQSRTAAGGWSQQRYARRRSNQADALAEAVATHTASLVVPGTPAGLVVGGDRMLVRQVLADPRLAALGELPRRELYDLPDPTRAVLDRAVQRGRAVRVTVTEGSHSASGYRPGP